MRGRDDDRPHEVSQIRCEDNRVGLFQTSLSSVCQATKFVNGGANNLRWRGFVLLRVEEIDDAKKMRSSSYTTSCLGVVVTSAPVETVKTTVDLKTCRAVTL